jgi:light-harvesting complex I chlorophyll a/b binding protein 1
LDFDPLGLKPTDPDAFIDKQNKELNNGRLAMLGISGMIAQELVNGQKIVETLQQKAR